MTFVTPCLDILSIDESDRTTSLSYQNVCAEIRTLPIFGLLDFPSCGLHGSKACDYETPWAPSVIDLVFASIIYCAGALQEAGSRFSKVPLLLTQN